LVRVAGRGSTPTGESVIWSVAEGHRGRRWREVVLSGRGIAHSLLLEIDPEGRFAHVELSTPTGLLTLHPEGDGTLHGNAVVSDGVEHVRGLAWEPGGIAVIDGSIVCLAAAIPLAASRITAFGSVALHAVRIPTTFWLEVGPLRIERIEDQRWRFGEGDVLEVDERGLPRLRGGEMWPLERDDEAAVRHR
jgi:hypothetical protein